MLPGVELGGFVCPVAFGFGGFELLLVFVFGVVALVFGEPVCVVLPAGTQAIAPPFAGIPLCGVTRSIARRD